MKDRIQKILARMREAASKSPLAVDEATLITVSKTHPESVILQAIDAGQNAFGENRVQEAATKWPEIKKQHPHLALHMIGPLQTNKVKEAVALFDVIQTVDREKLADILAKEMAAQDKKLPCFIQVNTGEEPQKAGITPQEADRFISYCKDTLKLPVVGLMCVPPAGVNPAPHFALLKQIADRNGLEQLSMGMSGDFETAIRLGATHVRVGTAIFGEREQ